MRVFAFLNLSIISHRGSYFKVGKLLTIFVVDKVKRKDAPRPLTNNLSHPNDLGSFRSSN